MFGNRSFSRFTDPALLDHFATVVARDRVTTTEMLACMAEIDSRRLYVPAGYSSMFLFCVHRYGFSDHMAFTRIRAARAARRFPTIFAAIHDGRLHVSAVVMLNPYLTTNNAAELLAAAAGKTKTQVELLLAERFPKPGVPTFIQPVPAPCDSPHGIRLGQAVVHQTTATSTSRERCSPKQSAN